MTELHVCDMKWQSRPTACSASYYCLFRFQIGSLQLWRKQLSQRDAFALATLNMDPDQVKAGSLCIKDFGLPGNRDVKIVDVVANRTICSACRCFSYNLRPTSSLLVTV